MLKFLGSVKLTIVLLILLVAASILGTLVPQTWTEEQYRAKYGDSGYSALKNLQLTDVYHSYWFSALLAALCINLCVCSIQGFGPLIRSLSRSSSTAGRVKLPDLPFHEKIRLGAEGAGSDEVIQKVKDTLSRGLYRVKYTDAESGVCYFERGKLGRLGPLITHASIIIILLGGIFVSRFGFKGYENIPEGATINVPRSSISSIGMAARGDLNSGSISEDLRQELRDSKIPLSDDATVSVKEADFRWIIADGDKVYIVKRQEKGLGIFSYAGFQLRVDDFNVEFYPDRSPKEYTSVLTVIENGVEKLTRTIEVNSPLKYKGVKFYQSGYGPINTGGIGHMIEVELSKKVPGESETEARTEVVGRFNIHIGDVFQVPDSQLRIKVATVVPDFVRDGDGNIRTRSDKPNNPAALLELYEGDEPEPKHRTWSFLKFPDFHGGGGADYALKFVSMGQDAHTEPKYYTGLQIAYHPGLPIIWVGCLIMVAGMFLSFYLSFKRLWVRVSDGSVEIGGRSYKNRSSFEKEFERLKAALG